MEHLGVLFVLKSSLLEMMLIDIIKTSTLIRTLKLGSRINYVLRIYTLTRFTRKQ